MYLLLTLGPQLDETLFYKPKLIENSKQRKIESENNFKLKDQKFLFQLVNYPNVKIIMI